MVVAFRFSIPRDFSDTRTVNTSDLVFFRRGFQNREPVAFQQIHAAMSTFD